MSNTTINTPVRVEVSQYGDVELVDSGDVILATAIITSSAGKAKSNLAALAVAVNERAALLAENELLKDVETAAEMYAERGMATDLYILNAALQRRAAGPGGTGERKDGGK